MQIRQISDDYSVAPQIGVEHVPLIAGAGFKTIICNRPDDEDPGQPPVDTIREAAEKAGMTFRHLPVISGQMTEDDVRGQAALLDEVPKPVLAYCRSGTRCTNLYAAIRNMRA